MNNKRKPIIGITTSLELNPKRLNDHKTIVSVDYSKAVINAGGIPFILPITENMEVIREQIQHLDGLLLSGGGDPDPILYGEDCLQEVGSITPERDKFELTILDEFIKTGKQDVKYIDTTVNHMQKWLPDLPTHDINIEKDNILFEIFGEKTRINSYHHQMIKDLGNDLTSIAKANDGIIEAFQNKNHRFFYAVQWHPEMMAVRGNEKMQKIFDKFIESCNN